MDRSCGLGVPQCWTATKNGFMPLVRGVNVPLEALEDAGGAHATPDAHGDHAVA